MQHNSVTMVLVLSGNFLLVIMLLLLVLVVGRGAFGSGSDRYCCLGTGLKPERSCRGDSGVGWTQTKGKRKGNIRLLFRQSS